MLRSFFPARLKIFIGSMRPPSHRTSFEDALSQLQGALSTALRIAVIWENHFFSVAFVSRLARIETPVDNQAVTLCFDDGETIDLNPAEAQAFSLESGGLEWRLGSGLILELRPA
jgi:hypothetical protein